MIADLILRVGKISLLASLLIVLLLALTPLLQKRYRARWRYFAWLVIALRLLVPMGVTLPQAPIHIEFPTQPTAAVVPPPSDERPYVQVDIPQWAANTPAPDGSEAPVEVDPPDAIAISPLTIAGGVWLAGMLIFLLFQIASYQVFLYKLKTSQTQEAPQKVKETVWRIGVDMGICRLPEAVVTDAIDAPVLIGVLRPRVLLPHADYSGEEIAFILRHELVHYRRRDMWYKLVLLLAGAVHWFNPLVYLMTVQAAKDIELACDDDVARELGREERTRYGKTILAALPQKRRLEPVFSTHFGSTKQNMKSRLNNLFDMAAKRRGIAALCAFALCAVAVTGIITVGFAAEKPNDIPLIGEEFAFSVPSIAPGEVVCVGRIELGPNASYSGSFSVESGSDTMLGLYDKPDATHSAGVGWNQSFGGTGSKIWFSSNESKTMYVYVGSRNGSGTRLTGVSGELVRAGTGSTAASSQTPVENVMIHANDASGKWAAASSIEGSTWQKQMDEEISWLENTYREHNTRFVIAETLPKSEAYNISRIEYLYDHSEVFRAMSGMQDGVFQLEDGDSFSGFSDFHNAEMIQRTAVMLENDNDLTVDVNYTLTDGEMELWLVNPSGQRVYWNDRAASFSKSFTVAGARGLWSVVTVREGGEGGSVSGNIALTLRQSGQSQSTAANDTIDEIPTLTGSNNVTVKSIEAGEVTCIGKIDLGPDSAYTATISAQSGSGAMIALHDSPNVTSDAGTGWNQYWGGTGNNRYFSSEQPKTAYVYVGSQADGGTKLTNVTVSLVQTKTPVSPEGNPYFQIKSNGKSILHSGSFEAKAGQTLTITATSNIKGGTVDFFLFSPAGSGLNEVTSFTFDGSNATKTVELSAGRWAYNCTGFFDSGEISITGTRTLGEGNSAGTQSPESGTEKYDAEGIRIMENTGTWGDTINRLLPSMSPGGVEKVVDIYLERHLFPNITSPEAARQVASTIEPALKYMTKEAGEATKGQLAAYY